MSVPLHVQRQVVGAREGALAFVALEWLLARVLPEVARQLVRPSELPRAARPRARVRLLACVRALVRLEVGALGVDLLAALEVALVHLAAPQQVRVCGDGGGRWLPAPRRRRRTVAQRWRRRRRLLLRQRQGCLLDGFQDDVRRPEGQELIL